MVAAAMAIDTSVWVGPLFQAANGADFSALMGLAVGGGIYFVLARSGVRQEALRTGNNEYEAITSPGGSAEVAASGP